MSLLNKASLIQIPSGYKDGTLYSAKPTNGDGDFTFSRGSNLAATRVNSDGLIEKGRENLLLQSNQFDTTWTKSVSITVTSGQSGYDGTNDAWLLERSDGSARYIQQSVSLNGVNTFSFYAKADNENWAYVGTSSGNAYCYYNLADGSVGNNGSLVVDANAEDIGNGWYRCSMTVNGTFTFVRIYPAVGNGSISGATDASIFIQDAQTEVGLVSTPYIETGASTAQAGILEDMPRLDYSGGATCPSCLLEPQRTNLLTHSEYFDTYTQANLTISTNATTSPEGLQNASKLVSSSGVSIKRIQPSITTSSATDYIISAFVKKAEWDYFFIYGDGTLSSGQNAIWDLENGTITQGSGHTTIESFGEGWYKITWKATASGAGSAAPRIGITDNSTGVNSTGDGTSGVFLYGLQIEEGSYSTSLIPTYGASVTRGADSCSKTGISSLIGQTEGTLFADFEIDADNTNNYNRVLAVGDGTSNNRIFIFAQNTEVFRFYVANSGAAQVDIVSSTSILGGRHKVAFAYKANDFIAYVDGVQVGTDTSGTIPSCSNVYVGTHEAGSTQPLEGGINQAILFPTRLSNNELATLTTL